MSLSVIESMLEKYSCETQADYERAIHEIIQEIALLGLWRAKFFEHAAFYGGTALRILYGLDRFSEDLDFSLLKTDRLFDLSHYNAAIKTELNSVGFSAEVETKVKNQANTIRSAFIKANTRQQFLNIHVAQHLIKQIPKEKVLKIKMEVDVEPPLKFHTETKILLDPIPFSVHTFTLSCLFSGKLHALLCRAWKNRVKGRDWYDFIWYIRKKVKPDLLHLKERLVQTGHWSSDALLDSHQLKNLLLARIQTIDFEQAKEDIMPFIADSTSLALWSPSFFSQLVDSMEF